MQCETSKIKSAIKRNLINYFRAAGIYPLDRQQVFKRLPLEVVGDDPTPVVEDSLTSMLKEQRFGNAERAQRKKKRLDVAPGGSISTAVQEDDQQSDDDDHKF